MEIYKEIYIHDIRVIKAGNRFGDAFYLPILWFSYIDENNEYQSPQWSSRHLRNYIQGKGSLEYKFGISDISCQSYRDMLCIYDGLFALCKKNNTIIRYCDTEHVLKEYDPDNSSFILTKSYFSDILKKAFENSVTFEECEIWQSPAVAIMDVDSGSYRYNTVNSVIAASTGPETIYRWNAPSPSPREVWTVIDLMFDPDGYVRIPDKMTDKDAKKCYVVQMQFDSGEEFYLSGLLNDEIHGEHLEKAFYTKNIDFAVKFLQDDMALEAAMVAFDISHGAVCYDATAYHKPGHYEYDPNAVRVSLEIRETLP